MNRGIRLAISAGLATFLGVSGFGLVAGGAATSTGSAVPSAFGWVYSGSPNTVEPSTSELDASANTFKAYLAFQSPVPAGATVTGASLTLVPKITKSGGFNVYPTSTFTPATLTWNSRPKIGSTLLGTTPSTVAGVSVTVPLTGLVVGSEVDLALGYSIAGTIGRISTTGISLSVTYSANGTTTTTTTAPTTTTTQPTGAISSPTTTVPATTTTTTTVPAATTTTTAPATPTTTVPPTTTPTTTPVAGSTANKVIVIMEENHAQGSSYSSMPYLAGLSTTYGKATKYYAIGHPSLPNYLEIWGGSAFGTSSDCGVGCGPIGAGDTSIWDQTIAAGKPAKAYQESMNSNCQTGSSAGYVARHGPWPYFTNATSRANCVANDVPLTALQADITAGNLPVTGEITPNLTNDWHDGTAAQADAFLKVWVPALMAGPDYTAGRLTILVVTDEDDSSAGNNVAFTVINPKLSGVTVATTTNHYSLTRWLEDNAGTGYLGGASTAFDLKAAFGL